MLSGAVGRVVVDEDGFPVDAFEQLIQPFEQRADIVALVECRNDDRELGSGFRFFPQGCSQLANCRGGRFAQAAGEGAHEPILKFVSATAAGKSPMPHSPTPGASRAVLRSWCQGYPFPTRCAGIYGSVPLCYEAISTSPSIL